MLKNKIAAVMAVSMAASGILAVAEPMTVMADSTYDMRKKVVGLSGIMNVDNLSAQVTRAEFARMLVNASLYREVLTNVSSVSVFADVPKESQYASAVRIAAEQGWMTGYLGGNFKPDSYITLQEAVRGVLALLGYTGEDFSNEQLAARMSKYYYLELNENISREAGEILTRDDCVNLFYNLLKTNQKGSTAHYGSVLDIALTSDGEVDALTIADNSVKGPKLVKRTYGLSDAIPFSVSDANLFLDGNAVRIETIKQVLQSDGYLVIYYSTSAKTVWAYSASGDAESDKRVIQGEVTNIYYKSTNELTPSAVVLDNGEEYALNTADMQFAFSVYGSIKVGDDVTLIYSVATTGEDMESYTIVDYLED